MEMASRILPSFRRRRSDDDVVPATPEELLDLEMRLWDVAPAAAYELQKRRHWTPEMVAREAEKRRWVAEQKRLIAKESKRLWRRGSSGASSVVDVVLDESISLDEALGEEFERRRFFEELRLHAAARRESGSAAAMDSSKVDHPVVAVTEDDEDEHVPARGDEGYLERRRELLGRYCLAHAGTQIEQGAARRTMEGGRFLDLSPRPSDQ